MAKSSPKRNTIKSKPKTVAAKKTRSKKKSCKAKSCSTTCETPCQTYSVSNVEVPKSFWVSVVARIKLALLFPVKLFYKVCNRNN